MRRLPLLHSWLRSCRIDAIRDDRSRVCAAPEVLPKRLGLLDRSIELQKVYKLA